MKITPKKSLGQNFLVNEGVVKKIIDASELTAEDTVIEVGPGTGNLTRALVETGARVIAVEKDHRLIEDLEAEFSAVQIEIVEGDILNFDIINYLGPACRTGRFGAWDLEFPDYKIIGNLPYYITSHFLKIIFEKWPIPALVVLTIQKEVAQRIVAKPPDMNLLALSVQYHAEPEIISYVSKGSFRPEPKVDSAIIKLVPKTHVLSPEKEKQFFSIIKTAFAGKRKQLLNTLPTALPDLDKEKILDLLKKAGIDPQARPETVDMDSWLILVNGL